MNLECFFDAQTQRSKVKSKIVSKYFASWARVMSSRSIDKIAYIDLYSGPGRYKDGSPSTPLMVAERAIKIPPVRKKVRLIFNDNRKKNIKVLKREILGIPDIGKLRYEPVFWDYTVDEQTTLEFSKTRTVPSLSFVDPCGYKGLSLPLIKALVKDWGCDSIFFFNYRRLNPGIENKALEKPVSLVFTREILYELRDLVKGKSPAEREKVILDRIKLVFKAWGMPYVLPFPFKNKSGRRTTHYLIFVSKHVLGYNIMKEIMGAESSCKPRDVPTFEFNPASTQVQYLLFYDPIKQLEQMLLSEFAGATMELRRIYETHHIDKPYILRNYKTALLNLESKNMIKTNRSQRRPKPRQGTFPDDLIVTFSASPRKDKHV